MNFQDKSIQCSDCGTTFTFSAEEQDFSVYQRCSDSPKRCSSCRAARKMERYGDGEYSYRSRSW